MGYRRGELDRWRGATVPDLLGPRVRLLFVGINPGLWTAAAQAHFARPGNRFYPALFAAGLLPAVVDASAGYSDADRELLSHSGIGITNLVARATARADELNPTELVAGAGQLLQLVERVRPVVVAVAGITAYRTAFGLRQAVVGRQPQDLGGSQLWVVPNPSGLNAHDTVASLGAAYRLVGVAAGLVRTDDDRHPRRPRD